MQETFERKEIKYILSDFQYRSLRREIAPFMAEDHYGLTGIYNIYYDTPSFLLIRRSMEKPVYKEKLRLRSYGIPTDSSPVFIEIKKKYKGIVYKRRIEAPYKEAACYLSGGPAPHRFCGENPEASLQEMQIFREIDHMLRFYKNLQPAMAIAYDRIALFGTDNPSIRMTFDTNLRFSPDELDVRGGNHGEQILNPGEHLMELKIRGAMDIRLAGILSSLGIFSTGISKYGRGFEILEGEIIDDGGREELAGFFAKDCRTDRSIPSFRHSRPARSSLAAACI